MTNIDARPSAWIGAHERIIAAQTLKTDPNRNGRVRDELPEIYWATIAEAAVLAELARADVNVGLSAGAYLEARDERIESNRARHLLDVGAAKQRATEPPFAVGHRVRITDRSSAFVGRIGTVADVQKSLREGGAAALIVEFTPDEIDPVPDRQIWVSARDVVLVEAGQ